MSDRQEFELRRRVFVQARAFFDCDDGERRREHLAELETRIAAYYAHASGTSSEGEERKP